MISKNFLRALPKSQVEAQGVCFLIRSVRQSASNDHEEVLDRSRTVLINCQPEKLAVANLGY